MSVKEKVIYKHTFEKIFAYFVTVVFAGLAMYGAETLPPIKADALVTGGAAKGVTTVLADSYRYDLRPGIRISCRVKFDETPIGKDQMTILQKGNASIAGSWLLRVDPPAEGGNCSFFVNLGEGPEPRVSVPISANTGVWHDVSAGWDGTSSWLSVDGRIARKRRRGSPLPLGCADDLRIGPFLGTVADLSVTGPDVTPNPDTSCRPGFRLSCEMTFLAPPVGEGTIAIKDGEYWLRYDKKEGERGAFSFFVFIDGGWEPHATFQHDVETGRVYAVSAEWDGRKTMVSVDGEMGAYTHRSGRCRVSGRKLSLGTPERIAVAGACVRHVPRLIASLGGLHTRKLLPRLGAAAHLIGEYEALGACTLDATASGSAKVTPTRMELAGTDERPQPLAWIVDPGTNGIVDLAFTMRQDGEIVGKAAKRLVFMPAKDPDYSARAWNPPLVPTRTYHVDAEDGDDARDGLTPATAWKSFANVTNLTLGPGERLLLKRGSVFDEELRVRARGMSMNWSEVGAYGEGMRPQIRRRRHIGDRCGVVKDPAFLVVRDLVFCNAGKGLEVLCDKSGSGHVLVERCLAHHIVGHYRYNAHGMPDGRDNSGLSGSDGVSGGILVRGRHIVLRDCEAYQCSSAFSVNGTDTFVTRMYSHDNYAHNTSPHPYNTASRSWMTDSVFDASGWHASAGTMGVMLANNCGFVIRGCHFLNQPDSGSHDQGGIDFEAGGENCLVEGCTFRNNAGAAIEMLGLRRPQVRNVHIRRCKFDRNNRAYKNGPAEIQVWGSARTPRDIACSNGLIEDNGCVLIPGVPFYVNNSPTTNDWALARNREFDFPEELDRAFPCADPPNVSVCGEVWTDRPEAALFADVTGGTAELAWEQMEGPAGVTFAKPDSAGTRAAFPGEGDYRVQIKADNGTLWRTARTAVHVLPPGTRTFKAWDFAKNLDAQGWRAEATGTAFEYLFVTNSAYIDSFSFPVRIVCGDYFVVAMRDAPDACLLTPDDMNLGVDCSRERVNAMRIRMQNATSSSKMRLWWQTCEPAPAWDVRNSVGFGVKRMDGGDSVYTVQIPPVGRLKQLKLSFSDGGENVTGTCRIDYIWLGRLGQ